MKTGATVSGLKFLYPLKIDPWLARPFIPNLNYFYLLLFYPYLPETLPLQPLPKQCLEAPN
jgi:hypothetical protein